jgi:CDGSH iron-sulfur domain-containing protein 3
MEEKNATFRIIEGGPLEVTGKFRIVDSAGSIIEHNGTVYLCRCGASRNKPFCDDSHKVEGFAM